MRKGRHFPNIQCPKCKVLCRIPPGGSFAEFPTSRRRDMLVDLLTAADETKSESLEECVSCDVKEVEYRCDKCKLRINVKCVIESPSKRFESMEAEYKDELEQMLNTMEEKIVDYELDLERDVRKFRASENKIHAAKKRIGRTVDTLVNRLRKREAELMEHLDELYKVNKDEHFKRKENLELNLDLMRSLVDYARESFGKETEKTPMETSI